MKLLLLLVISLFATTSFAADLVLVDENGKSINTIKDAVKELDPDTKMKVGYASYPSRIRLDPEEYVGVCKGKQQLYRYVSNRADSNSMYLLGGIAGNIPLIGKACVEYNFLRKIKKEDIVKLLRVQESRSGFNFEKWVGETSFTIKYGDTMLLFNNIKQNPLIINVVKS